MPRPPPLILHTAAALLRAAALSNERAGRLRVDEGEWISMAAQELMDGFLPAPPDLWRQSGPGFLAALASLVAERASECMVAGEIRPDQVSLAATFPAAGFQFTARLCVALHLQSMLSAWHSLHPEIQRLCRLPPPDPGDDPGDDPGRDPRYQDLIREAADILGLELLIDPEQDGGWQDGGWQDGGWIAPARQALAAIPGAAPLPPDITPASLRQL